MKYKINGMHCEACKTLIKMELEENGFSEVEVDGVNHEIIVPENLFSSSEEIKAVVNNMDSYSVEE